MIRAKQLGALSQCARTFILNGSRCGNADGASTSPDGERSIPGRQTRISNFIHDQNDKTARSPKLKDAIEAVLPPRASSRGENSSNKRVGKQKCIESPKDSVPSSKVCSKQPVKSSVSPVDLSETVHEDVKTANFDGLLQTQSSSDANSSSLSGSKPSGLKNHRTTGVNSDRSMPSGSLRASESCSSLESGGSNYQAKPYFPKSGQCSQSGRPCSLAQDQRQQGSISHPPAAIHGHSHAHPSKIKGRGRHAIELYHHTLLQLRWGPAAEETLHKISYKLDPFQANQVLKLLDDHTVALGFFNWLKRQPGFKHDNHTYTTMVGILGRAKQFGAIRELLDEMARGGCKPNVVTYNRLIHGYGQANYMAEAVNVFRQMQEAGCNPDHVTYCTLIDIHAKAGYLKVATDLYRRMQQAGLSPDTFTYSVMINCLGKAGHLPLADELFGEMVRQGWAPNLVTYNIMIALHAKARNHSSVLRLHRSMQAAGFRPDKITYCIVMEVLGYCGHIGEAEALFMEMKQDFVPDEPAYGLLVDMCGKAGHTDKAWAWYQTMLTAGLRPNVPTCNSLLSAFLRACRFLEARHVLQSMLELGLEPSLQTFTLLLSCCLETKSHMKHCREMMAITGHPAHAFLLYLPAAEPGGQNVKDHAGAFLDLMRSEDRESKRGIVDSVVDFLHKSGFKEEAGSVWEVAAQRNVYPDAVKQKRSSYWVINLHVMSDGTAIIALSRTMAWFRRQMLASGLGPRRIDIITGWGRRSRVTGASLVRQSVGELLHLFRFPFFSENGNSGCFVGCGDALESWLLNSFVERMHLL